MTRFERAVSRIRTERDTRLRYIPLKIRVARFELAVSCIPSRRDTRLRYTLLKSSARESNSDDVLLPMQVAYHWPSARYFDRSRNRTEPLQLEGLRTSQKSIRPDDPGGIRIRVPGVRGQGPSARRRGQRRHRDLNSAARLCRPRSSQRMAPRACSQGIEPCLTPLNRRPRSPDTLGAKPHPRFERGASRLQGERLP